MDINIKKLKRELTKEQIIKIVESLGGELYNSINDEPLIFYSCCHHLNPSEHKPKLYYYSDTYSFFCYSCSSAFDIISLIQTRWVLENKNLGFKNALEYIGKVANIALGDLKSYNKTTETNISWQEILGKYNNLSSVNNTIKTYDKNILNFFSKKYPLEWLEQGISLEAMEAFNIRYYDYLNQTTIPCYDIDNNLVGIRVRNWNPDLPKYDIVRLVDSQLNFKCYTNFLLYGLNIAKYPIEQKKTVILVESEKAVMKSYTWYKHNSITVGMFGGHLSSYQRNLLLDLGIDKVIIVPDYDYHDNKDHKFKQWIKKQQTLAKQFNGFCQVEIVVNIDNIVPYKDNIFDTDKKTYDSLMDNRQEFWTYLNNVKNTL